MPYFKGIYFEQAFYKPEDLHAHNAATSPIDIPSPPVEEPPKPVPEEPRPPPLPEVSLETQPGQDPGPEDVVVDLAVSVEREISETLEAPVFTDGETAEDDSEEDDSEEDGSEAKTADAEPAGQAPATKKRRSKKKSAKG